MCNHVRRSYAQWYAYELRSARRARVSMCYINRLSISILIYVCAILYYTILYYTVTAIMISYNCVRVEHATTPPPHNNINMQPPVLNTFVLYAIFIGGYERSMIDHN